MYHFNIITINLKLKSTSYQTKVLPKITTTSFEWSGRVWCVLKNLYSWSRLPIMHLNMDCSSKATSNISPKSTINIQFPSWQPILENLAIVKKQKQDNSVNDKMFSISLKRIHELKKVYSKRWNYSHPLWIFFTIYINKLGMQISKKSI